MVETTASASFDDETSDESAATIANDWIAELSVMNVPRLNGCAADELIANPGIILPLINT